MATRYNMTPEQRMKLLKAIARRRFDKTYDNVVGVCKKFAPKIPAAKDALKILSNKKRAAQWYFAETSKDWGPKLDQGIIPKWVNPSDYGLTPQVDEVDVVTEPKGSNLISETQARAILQDTFPAFMRNYCAKLAA